MKVLLFILWLCCSLTIHAQTKKIAHKSHSGSEANFALENYLDNLGLPNYGIDSIRKINDTTLLEYCSMGFSGSPTKKDTIYYKKELYILDSIENKNDSLMIYHRREFMTLKKEVDTIPVKSYNNRLHKSIYPGYNETIKRINFEKDEKVNESDSLIKKEIIPVINHSPNNQEKKYNQNALKNFIYLSFAVIGLSIMSFVLVLKRKRYA